MGLSQIPVHYLESQNTEEIEQETVRLPHHLLSEHRVGGAEVVPRETRAVCVSGLRGLHMLPSLQVGRGSLSHTWGSCVFAGTEWPAEPARIMSLLTSERQECQSLAPSLKGSRERGMDICLVSPWAVQLPASGSCHFLLLFLFSLKISMHLV